MSNQLIVLGNIPLFYNIVEYLSSKEILNLFLLSKLFTNCLNTTYDKVIYKIYKKLYLPLKVKNKLNFDILIIMTIKLIKIENAPNYIIQKNSQFTTEEIIIRQIIYNIVKYENITSIYYLLYENGFHQLLNRYIIDKIVISPYECTLSNTIRKKLHYYGNEQTLRMALRFKKHNMVKQILSDMEYIMKNNSLWFIWNDHNVLYESIYNNDYVGFEIMVEFIVKKDKRRHFILEISDSGISTSDMNEYDIESDNRHTEMNDNYFSHFNKNALTYTLIKNINAIFKNWDWIKYFPLNLDSNDFIISEDSNNFIISERFLEYMNNQKKDIIQHYKKYSKSKNLTQFRLLVSILNIPDRVDIYSHIINDDGYDSGYYLLPYLIVNTKLNCHKNIFIILCIIFHYFDNFNIDFIYHQLISDFICRCPYLGGFHDTHPNTCNTLEYITHLIKRVYVLCDDIFMFRDGRFIHHDRFIYFVNLLLIHNMLLTRQTMLI